MVSKRGNIRHVEINVSAFERSKAFYHDFLEWLGYKDSGFHRRRVGLNHIAFQAKSRADVDRLYSEFLVPRSIRVLYGGPKEYPEYRKGYYSVYFEDPDRIKLEFVH